MKIQKTEEINSPNIITKGDVTVNYNSNGYKEVTAILKEISEDRKNQTRIINFLKKQINEKDLKNKKLIALAIKFRDDFKNVLNDTKLDNKIKSLLSKGRFNEAENIANRKFNESHREYEDRIATLYYQLGSIQKLCNKNEDALENFKKYYTVSGSSPEGLDNYVYIAFKLGRYSDVIQTIEQHFKYNSSPVLFDTEFIRAICYKNIGKYNPAILILKRLSDLKIDNIKTIEINNILIQSLSNNDYELIDKLIKNNTTLLSKITSSHETKIAVYQTFTAHYNKIRDTKKGLKYALEAKILADKIDNYQGFSTIYNNLSLCYLYSGNDELAEEYCLKALAIDTSNFGESHPQVGSEYYGLSQIYQIREDFKKALKYSIKAYKSDIYHFPSDSKRITDHLERIINLSSHLNDKRIKIEYLYIFLESTSKDSHKRSGIFLSLSKTHQELGMTNNAIHYLEEGLKFIRESTAGNNYEESHFLLNLSILFSYIGDHNKVIKHAHKALKIKKNIFNKDYFDICLCYQLISCSQFSIAETEKAIDSLKNGLEVIDMHGTEIEKSNFMATLCEFGCLAYNYKENNLINGYFKKSGSISKVKKLDYFLYIAQYITVKGTDYLSAAIIFYKEALDILYSRKEALDEHSEWAVAFSNLKISACYAKQGLVQEASHYIVKASEYCISKKDKETSLFLEYQEIRNMCDNSRYEVS